MTAPLNCVRAPLLGYAMWPLVVRETHPTALPLLSTKVLLCPSLGCLSGECALAKNGTVIRYNLLNCPPSRLLTS